MWAPKRQLRDLEKRISGLEEQVIKILTDNNFVVSDYFIPSSYRDASGKENVTL